MLPLPAGTVTFLFTDIEGSTKLWEEHPEGMRLALARHDALLRQTIEANNGVVFKTVGDAFCAAFATAPDALTAALQAQTLLNHGEHGEDTGEKQRIEAVNKTARLPEAVAPASDLSPSASVSSMVDLPLPLRVRMALHTGAAERRDNDYFGPPLNRVARLLALGYGGQTLLSDVAQALARDTLPFGASLKNLGEHRLRDLSRSETVFQLLHPGLPADFPPLKSLDNPELPNNLPIQVTSFVGREKEMVEVRTLLAGTRLLTLTGSGGCGKTRLALQVAADVLDTYTDGAWFVELAPLADGALVPSAVAQAVNVSEEAGKPLMQTLTAALKNKKMLLVLDNCEHVLDACARLADALIHACPALTVLASSREGLGIAGETVYRIPSLSLPDPRKTATPENLSVYEAVRLFVDRAAAALPAFAVTNHNAPAVASICHRLDGIPLAIELAAARIRSLSVEEINTKLDNRFRLLTGGSRTALPRLQTLRALVDWSYDLLNAPERTLLCRLSVFTGGWTMEAAEAICAGEEIETWEVLDLLTSLIDKSLVTQETQTQATRYRLLETVRQYARERLQERGEQENECLRERHRDFYLNLADEAAAKPGNALWLKCLEAEHDNLRAALDWCLGTEGDPLPGARLCVALGSYWLRRSQFREAREYLERALASKSGALDEPMQARLWRTSACFTGLLNEYKTAADLTRRCVTFWRAQDNAVELAAVLCNLGHFSWCCGNNEEALVCHQEAAQLYEAQGNTRQLSHAFNCLGLVYWSRGDVEMAKTHWTRALELSHQAGHEQAIIHVFGNLCMAAVEEADYATAERYNAQSLEYHRHQGDAYSEAYRLTWAGYIAALQGQWAQARVCFASARVTLEQVQDCNGLASLALYEGRAAFWQGEPDAARAYLHEGVPLARALANNSVLISMIEELAFVSAPHSTTAAGIRVLAGCAGMRERNQQLGLPSEQARLAAHLQTQQALLGEAAYARAWAEGSDMDWNEAVGLALTL